MYNRLRNKEVRSSQEPFFITHTKEKMMTTAVMKLMIHLLSDTKSKKKYIS